MNYRFQRGYTVLVIIVLVSVALILASFWLIRRRTNIPEPLPQAQEESPPADTWVVFENKTYGVKFQYPENIFITNTTLSQVGAVTRVFLGSAGSGTLTAEVINRQFDPKDIVNESLNPVNTATALSVGGQIGYQYTDKVASCDRKVVQVPLGSQTLALVFASCVNDTDPKLLTNQDLIRQVLNSVRLSPPVPETEVNVGP